MPEMLTISGSYRPNPNPDAVSLGYTTCTFFDDFNSITTIDVNNTGASGYNWYVKNTWPNAVSNASGWEDIYTASPTPSSSISVSNSILTLNKTSRGAISELMLQTGYPANGGSTYLGQSFSGGFYMEAKVSTDITLAPANWSINTSSSYGWPIVWSFPTNYFLGVQKPAYDELDFLEFYVGISDANVDMGENEWLFSGNSWQTTNSIDPSVNQPAIGTPVYTPFHTVGWTWVPASQNSGTGYINKYFDGKKVSNEYTTWTGTGPGSALDSQSMMLILCSGVGWPFLVDYVGVWQT